LDGETESLYIIDRVAADLRAAGNCETNWELSVVHIILVDICDRFHELM
jgi:hypothetical protein